MREGTGTEGETRGKNEGKTVEELAPKVAPRRLGLLAPKLAIFYRVSAKRGRCQGPLEIQNVHPPL